MRRIVRGDVLRSSDLAAADVAERSARASGPGVSRTTCGTVASPLRKPTNPDTSPFAARITATGDAPAGRRVVAVRTGCISAGASSYTTGDDVRFDGEEDIDEVAVTAGRHYSLCWRIAVNPDTGEFDNTYFPELVVQDIGSDANIAPRSRGTHPAQFLLPWGVLFDLPCVYVEIGRFFAHTHTHWTRWRKTWQGSHVYVPVWYYHQTGDSKRPYSWFVASWLIPAGQIAVESAVPLDLS